LVGLINNPLPTNVNDFVQTLYNFV
jgi:hypothetical protein